MVKKKKVMHFIHGLSTGGAETLVKDYVLKLDRSRFEPVVMCLDHAPGSPYEEILRQAGIRVIYICDETGLRSRNFFFARVVKAVRKRLLVRKHIRTERPDVLHTHLAVNVYVKLAGPARSTRILHTVHNEPQALWFPSGRRRRSRRRDFRAAQWLVRRCGMRFIVLHDAMRLEVNALFHTDRSVVLNNGIDFSRFSRLRPGGDVRKELGIPPDAFIVGHVGRFTPTKNQGFLVDIFRAVRERNEKAFLLMIGAGEALERTAAKLRRYGLEESCKIFSNRADVPDLMNAMDVFVFPSLYEGLPVALIEAQKAGLPCVISDTIPAAAVISNLVQAVPLGESVERWAGAVCAPPPEHVEYTGLSEWDMDNVTARLQDIYEGVI